jgi:pimeloyl-ACP methyl ester carboxylesterase
VNTTRSIFDIEPGVRLHFVTAGTGTRTALLQHGFPQTWWEWREQGGRRQQPIHFPVKPEKFPARSK